MILISIKKANTRLLEPVFNEIFLLWSNFITSKDNFYYLYDYYCSNFLFENVVFYNSKQ